MADMTVSIVTPENQAFHGEASEVRVPGWDGEFDVLPGHDVVLSLLRAGNLFLTVNGTEKRFLVGRGFVEVTGGSVTILTDSCDAEASGDKAAAQADLDAAEAAMAESGELSGDWDALCERRELASAILSS